MNENLWAPWRMKYISKSEGTGNIFVDLVAENDDERTLILFRGKTAFVMLNAFPYTSGHLMVAPFRETNDLTTMSDEELLEINQLVAKSIRWLKIAFNPHGFNVGVNLGSAAGAGIPVHAHWHIVPRWSGDTNFMTTVGEIRVQPFTLEDTYQKLREIIQRDA